MDACLWTFICRTAVWSTENKKHATLNPTTRCLSLSVFSDWTSRAALHMNDWKCIIFSSYLLHKISRVVNHGAALLFFFVCSALETVWSCTRQAPSAGTTSAVEHRTVTYACTVGFILLQEVSRGTCFLYLFIYLFAQLSNATDLRSHGSKLWFLKKLSRSINADFVICADSTMNLL